MRIITCRLGRISTTTARTTILTSTCTWGKRIGEAANPGPPSPTPPSSTSTRTLKKDEIKVDIGNVTHLLNARHVLKDRKFDHFFGQEHSMLKQDWARTRQAYRSGSLYLSELDLEVDSPLGGICALRLDRRQNLTPQPRSKTFELINGKGRVQLYALDLSADTYVLVYNLYGWTNAAKDKNAANRTNDMLEAIIDDMEKQPPGPTLVLGDLNGDVGNFKILQEVVKDGTLIDVGAQAERWGESSEGLYMQSAWRQAVFSTRLRVRQCRCLQPNHRF